MKELPSKLKIQFIAETYPPEYGGGAAIYVQDVARGIAARGHEVRVFCTENGDREPYTFRTEQDEGVRIDRLNLPYFKTKDPDGWFMGWRRWRAHQQKIVTITERLIAEWRPDLAHYNTARPLGEECLTALDRQKVPIIAMLHEAWLICPRLMLLRSPTSQPCPGPAPVRCLECLYSQYDGSHGKVALKLPWRILKLGFYPAYRLYRRRAARRSLSGAFGYSQFMAGHHAPHIPGLVQYLPLGINLKDIVPSRANRPRSPLQFGFVAGFQPNKGIQDVLDAAMELKRQELPFALHVWGPGLERGPGEIARRGLDDRVTLHNAYQPEEIWKVYEKIDVALMATTVCEPFGRVPLEARAMGAPTIAPAIGGISETIRDGVDGLLYRFRDPQDLERQMRRVLVEPGLVESLIANQSPVIDTRERAMAVEEFYYAVLATKG